MEASANGSNIDIPSDIRDVAIEIFEKINKYIDGKINSGVVWQLLEASTVPTEATVSEIVVGSHEVCRRGSGSVQQHFISSVVFRCMRHANRDHWELETFLDYVNIRQLDEIRMAAVSESHHVSSEGQKDIKIAMAENNDIVLLRTIMDWSRPDGNVWSQQIIWTGTFSDSRRILLLVEMDSPSIQMRLEQFDLHPHFREQFIARHGTSPLAASISAVDTSQSIIISDELVGKDHGDAEGLICAVCHDRFSIGEPAKQLRCRHVYHERCICESFYFRLQCPLCRDEL